MSETGPTEEPMEVDIPVALIRPTESTADIGAGPPILQTSGHKTPDDQGSSGTEI